MKKKETSTSEDRQPLLGGVVSIIISILFLGLAYLLLKTAPLLGQIFGYVFLVWGVGGSFWGLREVYRTFK